MLELYKKLLALYQELLAKLQAQKQEYIIIHHTGGSDADPYADTSHHTVKMVDSWHKQIGFNKSKLGYFVGYHYFIEKSGRLWQCRGNDEMGCHCFPSSFEILTDKGWKLIKDIKKTDFISDVDDKLNMEFNNPVDIVHSKTKKLYTIKNNNLDIEATDKHEFLVKKNYQNKFSKQTFDSFFGKHNQVIPASVKYTNTTEYIDDDFLQLCIAIICDGSLIKSGKKNKCKGFSFNLKKERKIKEIKRLIEANGLKVVNHFRDDGASVIRFYSVDFANKFVSLFPNKQLDWWLLNIEPIQRNNILNYYSFWDGHSPKKYDYKIICSINKNNIDILQAIASISGIYRACVKESEPNLYEGSYPNGKVCYLLSLVKRNTSQISKSSYGVKKFDSEQDVYCVTTKKHNILVRNNGKVFVAGNCVGHNDSIGICLAGNFDATLPTEAQEDSLRELLLDLTQGKNVKIVPHRYFAKHKSCYGSLLADDWAENLIK